MKALTYILAAVAVLGLAACDKGSSGDPATESRSDLNPPSGLVTLTGDGQITLRWRGNNTEDGFKGYHVFVHEGDVTSLASAYSYPSASIPLTQASLPRCAGNTKLFQEFGFTPTERDCEGDTAADEGTTDTAATMMLQGDATADEGAEEEVGLGAIVKCAEGSSEKVSLAVEGSALGTQTCVVTEIPDGNDGMKAIANGATYSFFVASVLGDEYENISWTSNFVVDTPANAIFSGELTVKANQYLFLPFSKLQPAAAATSLTAVSELIDSDFTAGTCTTEICSIASTGNPSTNEAGIYLGRLGSGSYPRRVFFSTPAAGSGNTIEYAYRGPQTYDPGSADGFSTTIPDDQALEDTANASPYLADGKLTAVYENQVFDIAVSDGTTTNYGKVVVGSRTLAGEADTDDVTFNVTIIIQETAGVTHYLR